MASCTWFAPILDFRNGASASRPRHLSGGARYQAAAVEPAGGGTNCGVRVSHRQAKAYLRRGIARACDDQATADGVDRRMVIVVVSIPALPALEIRCFVFCHSAGFGDRRTDAASGMDSRILSCSSRLPKIRHGIVAAWRTDEFHAWEFAYDRRFDCHCN